jgi:hypothetical protein
MIEKINRIFKFKDILGVSMFSVLKCFSKLSVTMIVVLTCQVSYAEVAKVSDFGQYTDSLILNGNKVFVF